MALVGTIFKFKFSGQNIGGYGGGREHVAACQRQYESLYSSVV